MTASADWLSGERPPLPFREKTVIFDEEFADRFDAVFADGPVWPEVDQDTQPMRAVDPPTVEFRAVKPRRWSRQWLRENLSLSRVVWGGSSAVVLLATGLGRWLA